MYCLDWCYTILESVFKIIAFPALAYKAMGIYGPFESLPGFLWRAAALADLSNGFGYHIALYFA
jgi:hypothetical protein